MKNLTISFIILVGLLFLGIAIMIKPASFVGTSPPEELSSPDKLNMERIIPKEIIILGSALTIGGLVGLSILGFRIFKEIDREDARSN